MGVAGCRLGKDPEPSLVGSGAGGALRGFVNGALQKTSGDHPDVTGWYAGFLQSFVLPNATLWANMVALGEVLVGIGLILGALTGVAAFFGTVMNANYLLPGTLSTNPLLFILGTWLVLAWRVAGWWGLDRWYSCIDVGSRERVCLVCATSPARRPI